MRLYILPTGHGLVFFSMIIFMFLIAASTGNNLIYMLAFLLFTVFVVSMLNTHFNLKSLQLELARVEDGYAGDFAILHFVIKNPLKSRRFRFLIKMRQQGYTDDELIYEVAPRGQELAHLQMRLDKRGIFRVPKITFSTIYPMGLFYAWAVYNFPQQMVHAYPQRAGQGNLSETSRSHQPGEGSSKNEMPQPEDFHEHRRYQTGESQHHIDWKAYARSRELLTKRYSSPSLKHYHLHWQAVQNLGLEPGLSQLSQWIWELERKGHSFDLHLPDKVIRFTGQPEHAQDCLRELASFKAGG